VSRSYTLPRRLWDRAYAALTVGDWPARLATRLTPTFDVAVERHEVSAPAPLGDASALCIGFVADFHSGPSTPRPLIEKGLAMLAALGPDVILLGGDYVGPDLRWMSWLAAAIGGLRPPLGFYAVLGNHDHCTDAPGIVRALERVGVRFITNRCERLPAPWQQVDLCGIDDHTSGDPDAGAAFAGAGVNRVLLMHGPSNLLDVGEHPFTVALCGHTHGGQVLVAGRPAFVAHGPLSRRYNAGRYALSGGRTLLVSRGLGFGILPMRHGAPSSIMLCRLTHAA
jgi:predicted MPP superfamily phosphohydrolase